MTSKISFVNQLKEEIKHHVVSIFVVVLVMLVQLLTFHFELQSYTMREVETIQQIENSVASMVSPSAWKFASVVFIAVFLAAEYFSYLHSKKKTDFYMSLPIKRSRQFCLGMMTSGIIFVLPYIVVNIVEIILVYSSGYGTNMFMQHMVWNWICTGLIFASSWVAMALAMVLTGNLVIAIMGYIAFCGYIPGLIRELVPTFQNLFYVTYYDVSEKTDVWNYFSPISLIIDLSQYFDEWIWKEHVGYLVANIVFVVIVGYAAYVLYCRRPSEAAGRAMAFEKLNPLIRYLLVIPLALYAGNVLYEMSQVDSLMWLILGTLLGAILVHGIMESIYAFDIKRMFAKKRALAISVLFCAFFLAYFYANTDKYNEYIPSESEIDRIYMEVNNSYISYWDYSERESVDGIGMKNIRPALALAENAIIQISEPKATVGEEEKKGTVAFVYHLKNGKKVARRYDISLEKEENRALYDVIFATEDYKNDFYNIYSIDYSQIVSCELSAQCKSEKLDFSEDELKGLVDVYKKELDKLTYTELINEDRIASFSIHYVGGGIETYYIHENFWETIRYLNKNGKEIKRPFTEYRVMSVELLDFKDDKPFVITDKNILNKFKKNIILDEYYYGNDSYLCGLPDTYYGTAQVEVDGRTEVRGILIRKEDLQKIQ